MDGFSPLDFANTLIGSLSPVLQYVALAVSGVLAVLCILWGIRKGVRWAIALVSERAESKRFNEVMVAHYNAEAEQAEWDEWKADNDHSDQL